MLVGNLKLATAQIQRLGARPLAPAVVASGAAKPRLTKMLVVTIVTRTL
jgi:hypothetical protein